MTNHFNMHIIYEYSKWGAWSAQMSESPKVSQCSMWSSFLSFWVPNCAPRSLRVPKLPASALWLSLCLLCVSEYLIRCNCNKGLSKKGSQMYMTKKILKTWFWNRVKAVIWKDFDVDHINLTFVKIEVFFLWEPLKGTLDRH